jgi:NitT/TauT family transport system substrate-binding protein/sulfonate transport system substrate-binding protein
MILRRSVIAGAAVASLPLKRTFAATDKVLRVGYQKGSAIFMAAKQNGSLERALQPLGVRVEWAEFQYGPPMLEAMRVDSIYIGAVGDTPPIFAQVARANLLYVAAARSGAPPSWCRQAPRSTGCRHSRASGLRSPVGPVRIT